MIEQKKTKFWVKFLIVTIILLIPLFYFFSPMIFQGQRPTGVDISASKGKTNLYVEYQEKTGEKVLWNPNIFAGMPVYPRITPSIIHIDSIIGRLSKIVYTYFWYYLVGALGIFFLLRYKKIAWYIAIIPALAFMLLPHWMALIHVGHFVKLRAFMIMPWLILSFNYFIDKRSWLSVGYFVLAFSWITRTQHFQVVFYGILILLFLFLVPVFRLLIQKKWKAFGDITIKVLAAVILTIAVSYQPFMSLEEYTPHSTRGGNAVQITSTTIDEAQTKGVGLTYATRWSLDGNGLFGFVIPRFSGGLSQETYTGSKFPNLKGRMVPGYWGEMPFTQSYDSIGIIIFLFAFMGVWVYWKKDGFVRSLTVFSVFATFLALGRHLMPLYKLFYYIIPYFSKFRVPSMIVNMIFLAIIILAGYGIKAAMEQAKEKNWKLFAYTFGGASIILLIILLFSGGFAYTHAGEAARYGAQSMEIIKSIRKEFLQIDTLKAMVFALLTGGLLIGYTFKKIKSVPTYILLGLLVAIELFGVTNRAYKNMPLGTPATLERREFRQSDISRFLGQQSIDARAFALGQDSNHYSYFYPTISGYSAIKLQTIQDLREHCFYVNNGLNWNIINMLGGRYIISPGRLNEPFLQGVASDEARKEILYINSNALPKAWFVNKSKSFPAFRDMLLYMNTAYFNPEEEVLLLDESANNATQYSAEGTIQILENTPNTIRYAVQTDKPQFAVFSEMYYPEGWTLTKDGEEIKIIQSNYALRGAEIPGGEYTLDMEFHPTSYYAGISIVWIGDIIMLILIGGSIFLTNRDKIFKRKHSNKK